MKTSKYNINDTLSIWALVAPFAYCLLALLEILLLICSPALAIAWALDEEEKQYLKGEKPEWALTIPSLKGKKQ